MDNPFQSPAVLSLCPGFLGLERGITRAIGKIRVVAYVEIEAFIIENILKGMEAGVLDAAPVWTDLKTFDARPFREKIHGIIGGYPCQPFSLAGKRRGHTDQRHLWPFIKRIIATTGPLWCYFENVAAHLGMGYDQVYKDLSDLGYAVEPGIFTAEEVGAPHERKRLFILAISKQFLRYSGRKQLRWETWPNINWGSQGPELDYTGGNGYEPEHKIPAGRNGAVAAGQAGTEMGDAAGGSIYGVGGYIPEKNEDFERSEEFQQIKSVQPGRPGEQDADSSAKSVGGHPRCRGAIIRRRVGMPAVFPMRHLQTIGPGKTDTQLAHTTGSGLTQFGNDGIKGRQKNNRACYPSAEKISNTELSRLEGYGNDARQPQESQDWDSCAQIPNADSIELQERSGIGENQDEQFPAIAGGDHERYGNRWPAGPGEHQHGWERPRTIHSRIALDARVRALGKRLWKDYKKALPKDTRAEIAKKKYGTIEPGMGSTINGYNFREDLLRAYGNSVVEQTAAVAMIVLLKKHMRNFTK